MDEFTELSLIREFGTEKHVIEILEMGNLAAWSCSCGSPMRVSWVLGVEEAQKRASDHVEATKPTYYHNRRLK